VAIELHTLPNVWPAESLTRSREETVCSGEPQLDAALGGGWPTPALIEVLIDHYGIGELTLMLPLIKSLITTRSGTMTLWINAPYALHAVALVQHGLDPARHWIVSDLNERDAAWAFEVALRSGACSAVMGWLQRPSVAVLRRLKLATSTGHTTALLFRPGSAGATPSPATVRLSLTPQPPYLVAHLLKVQGRRQAQLRLDLRARFERVSSP
jgi:protein ImuA